MACIPGSSAEEASNDVRVGLGSQGVFLRVEGRGTHLNSEPLRLFLADMMTQGMRSFFLDLGKCSYLDSTFLGVLATACLKLKSVGGLFTLQRVGPRNLDLFETLGLVRFFQVDLSELDPMKGPRQFHSLSKSQASDSPLTTVLEAHRTLAQIDPRNAERFKDVIDCLQQEEASSDIDPLPEDTAPQKH